MLCLKRALGCAILLTAFALPKERHWVTNLPGAPMSLEGTERGAYTLKNTSGKQIVSFTLGCVELTKTRIIVVSRLPRKEFSIDPGGSFDEAIIDGPYTVPYQECVVKQKAKLALVSVAFEDRTSWSFRETKSDKSGKPGDRRDVF